MELIANTENLVNSPRANEAVDLGEFKNHQFTKPA